MSPSMPMPSRPAPRFVQANGLRFACLDEGEGPLVLLLHGFPDTAHTWDAVRPVLARAGHRAVSPFLRGYPPTEIPARGPFDPMTLGRDALALVEALGAERAILVGHDWGASAAYAAAILEPARVTALVTVAIPHPASMRPSLRLAWGARHFLRFNLPGAARAVRAHDFALVDELWHRWSPGWQVPPAETADVKEAFRVPGAVEAAIGYYRSVGPRVARALAHRITVPAAAFAGTDDHIVRVADYEGARSWYTKGYEVVAMPGGHFLHREHPERFATELLRVVASLSTSS